MFGKKEINYLVIVILVLAFVFGFNDGNPTFELGSWIINFIKVIIAVTISVVLCEWVKKYVAKKFGASCNFEIWRIFRYGLKKAARFPIKIGKYNLPSLPLGMILALIFTFISKGVFFFTPISNNEVEGIKTQRIGKRFANLTEFEEAIILLSGIFVNVALVLLFNMLDKISSIDFSIFVTINLWLALYSFLPLSSLNGTKIFFGSLKLYIFSLAFTILLFLMKGLSITTNVILSFVFACFIFLIYYYFKEYIV